MNAPKSLPLLDCPLCAAALNKPAIAILQQTTHKSVFHFCCQDCHQAMLFTVQQNRAGLSCAGIITDLTAVEAKSFLDSSKISINDVIQVHEALKLDKFLQIR